MYLEVLKYEDSETGKPTYFYIEDGKLKVNDFKPEFLRKEWISYHNNLT